MMKRNLGLVLAVVMLSAVSVTGWAQSACAAKCAKKSAEGATCTKALASKEGATCSKTKAACSKSEAACASACPKAAAEAGSSGSSIGGGNISSAIQQVSNESGGSPFVDLGEALPVEKFEVVHAQSGDKKSLKDFVGQKATVVVFWNKGCPYVEGGKGCAERVDALYKEYKDKGVSVIGVDSGINHTLDANKKYAEKRVVPILLNNNSSLAAALNAQYTPHTFVFDKDLKLVYKGAFDQKRDDKVSSYAKDAVDDVLAGKTPTVKEAKGMGCGIKWAEGAKPSTKKTDNSKV